LSQLDQFRSVRPYIVLTLIAVSLASVAIYSVSAYGALGIPYQNEPAVVIEIQPFVSGRKVPLSNDLVISVFITAPLPPSMAQEEGRDTTVVFAGAIKRYAAIPRKVLDPIVMRWNELFIERGVKSQTYIGLSVHIDVIDVAQRRSLLADIETVTLDLKKIVDGYVGHYVIGIDMSTQEKSGVVRSGIVSIRYYDPSTAPINSWFSYGSTKVQASSPKALNGYDRCVGIGNGLEECYKLTYYADVNDFADVLPSKYFKVVNGFTYMKVPVVVAINDFPSMSATVTVSIDTTISSPALGVYPTYAIGPNIAKAINNPNYPELPSVTIWRKGYLSWGGERFGFHRTLILHPRDATNTSWVWIYARPYIEIYSVYLVTDSGIDAIREESDIYLRDEVTFAISDILLNGTNIESDSAYGMPHEIINYYFFAGTNETFVTRLSPKESMQLRNIFQTFDKCGADFEVGIPVGAIVAAAASYVAPISAPVAAGLAGFSVTLSAVGASIYIEGGIENHGDVPGVPGDYNVGENVYIRISKFRYKVDPLWWCPWCSPCYYDVPVGIYFRFH